MSNRKTIITIGRQFGSGGHEIGATIAQDLKIKLYDKDILKRAAKESGICEELFEAHDETTSRSFLYSLIMDHHAFGRTYSPDAGLPLNHKLFLEQFNTIKNIASEESAVIVGRCADYALADNPDVINVFIYADLEKRIRRIARIYNLTDKNAKEIIIKNDKQRASYYNYYTNKTWGDAKSYHLCIDSGKFGIGGTAKMIEDYVKLRDKIENARI